MSTTTTQHDGVSPPTETDAQRAPRPAGAPKFRGLAWTAAAGAAGAVATAALPWLRAGGHSITGFHLAVLAERFGLTNGATSVLATIWLLAPLAAGACVALAALGRHRSAAVLGMAVVLVAVTAATVFLKISHGGSALGPRLTIGIAAVTTVLGAAAVYRERTHHGSAR